MVHRNGTWTRCSLRCRLRITSVTPVSLVIKRTLLLELEPLYANERDAIDTRFSSDLASDSGNDRSVTDAKFSRRKNEKRIRE